MPKNYLKALAVMIGYIIGVGMFGLPFLVNKSGILIFFILMIVLSLVQYFLHLIYANVILVTKEFHRLPGYSGVYLGQNGKRVATVAKLLGNYGALLAYIIITGSFLHELLSPVIGGSEFLYATILFVIEAVIVYFGIGMIAGAELFMTVLLLLVVAAITIKGSFHVGLSNYHAADWRYFLLPYGAILFATNGGGAIPIVAKLLDKNQKYVKSVVRVGTFIPAVVIMLFVMVVVGISGSYTSENALSGLKLVLDDGVVFFSLIFGVLTMITSFFGVAEGTREMYSWDYGLDSRLAWALAVFVPYILYAAGLQSLIEVIGFAGAVAGGLCAIILVMIFLKMKKADNQLVIFKHQPGKVVVSFLYALFICGIIYEIYFFIM